MRPLVFPYAYAGGDSAADLSSQSRRIFEELGDRLGTAENLYVGASIANGQDDPRRAVELAERALALYRELGSSIGQGHSLHILGQATAQLGQESQARQSLHEAFKALTEAGDARCSARVQSELGSLDLDEDDLTGATERFREALVMSSRIHDKLNIATALDGIGQIALASGDSEGAAVLLAAAEQLRDPLRVTRSGEEKRRHESRLETLSRESNASSLDAAWTRGKDMETEEAVTFALEYSPSENSTTPST
jgi:tetratricopeptide (TPR) repeat protein